LPRPHRCLAPGFSYHVMARGNARRDVFLDDHDRVDFLRRLDRIATARGWGCVAYCLMGTHFHLAVQTRQADLHDGMRDLLGRYAWSLNRRHDDVGHLFRDRYRAVVIERDGQMEATIVYILRNPVKAGLVDDALDWRWSNCATLMGHRRRQTTSALDQISALEYFSQNTTRAREHLRALLVGDTDVLVDPSESAARPSVGELLAAEPIDERIRKAVGAGYSHSEVAAALGLTRSAVSQRLRRRAAPAGVTTGAWHRW
jgi:REP element-mobilizing transposase RayT